MVHHRRDRNKIHSLLRLEHALGTLVSILLMCKRSKFFQRIRLRDVGEQLGPNFRPFFQDSVLFGQTPVLKAGEPGCKGRPELC